jgi:hypothetical protein
MPLGAPAGHGTYIQISGTSQDESSVIHVVWHDTEPSEMLMLWSLCTSTAVTPQGAEG